MVTKVRVGARVAVPMADDERPYLGWVRWVGHMHGIAMTMAGVQLDLPLGKSSGECMGTRYFEAEPDHAVFVPAALLDVIPTPAARSSSKHESDLEIGQLTLDEPSFQPAERSSRGPSSSAECSGATLTEFKKRPSIKSQAEMQIGIELDASIRRLNLSGSCVQIELFGETYFGVVRWVEKSDKPSSHRIVAIETERPVIPARRVVDVPFDGPPDHALVAPVAELKPDSRFVFPTVMSEFRFGALDSGVVADYSLPPSHSQLVDVCGSPKGIQGHRNSCYLDATLYALFAHSPAFDVVFLRPAGENTAERQQVIDVLCNEIIYPLRTALYRVWECPQTALWVDEERDPEELLTLLLDKVLPPPKAFCAIRQLLPSSSNSRKSKVVLSSANLLQIVVQEWSSPVSAGYVPDVQYLMERSLVESNMFFDKAPNRLIVQLPRSGRDRAFPYVLVNESIDVSALIDNWPLPCVKCNYLASVSCRECYMTKYESLADTIMCIACFKASHSKGALMEHCPDAVPVSPKCRNLILSQRRPILPHKLHLQSIICIESSHYVCFTRGGQFDSRQPSMQTFTGTTLGAWLFMDSMAGRFGENDGYCLPEVRRCEDISPYLTSEGRDQLRALLAVNSEHSLPTNALRVLRDAYFCIYTGEAAHVFQ